MMFYDFLYISLSFIDLCTEAMDPRLNVSGFHRQKFTGIHWIHFSIWNPPTGQTIEKAIEIPADPLRTPPYWLNGGRRLPLRCRSRCGSRCRLRCRLWGWPQGTGCLERNWLKQLCISNFKNLSESAGGDQESILSIWGSESLHNICCFHVRNRVRWCAWSSHDEPWAVSTPMC